MYHHNVDDIYLTIAKNIKRYRRLKGMTQKELAIRCGYSYSYIRKLEAPNIKKCFSIEIIFNISKALEIDIWKLFTD